eukprot:TRINITY_DN6104_c0_g1_i6.p1 TRINITY_DN6104_c0_g1~~TRINITY_DN6104_c0_g1_i6.p1  ORF type:complete len:297 (-),score=130.05 TRINITY_DN6104_c0_g1_i6:253-1143(-)
MGNTASCSACENQTDVETQIAGTNSVQYDEHDAQPTVSEDAPLGLKGAAEAAPLFGGEVEQAKSAEEAKAEKPAEEVKEPAPEPQGQGESKDAAAAETAATVPGSLSITFELKGKLTEVKFTKRPIGFSFAPQKKGGCCAGKGETGKYVVSKIVSKDLKDVKVGMVIKKINDTEVTNKTEWVEFQEMMAIGAKPLEEAEAKAPAPTPGKTPEEAPMTDVTAAPAPVAEAAPATTPGADPAPAAEAAPAAAEAAPAAAAEPAPAAEAAPGSCSCSSRSTCTNSRSCSCCNSRMSWQN